MRGKKSIREELAHVREMLTTAQPNELTTNVADKLGKIIERLDNLPAVCWSIAHDDSGQHGIITKMAEHAQNWRDAEHTSDDDILGLYPLDIKQ